MNSQTYVNILIINFINHIPLPTKNRVHNFSLFMSWLFCHLDVGGKPLLLYHVEPHIWLSLLHYPLKDTNASYFPIMLLMSFLWGFWQSGLTPPAKKKKKKKTKRAAWKVLGFGKQWYTLLWFCDSWHPLNPRLFSHNKTPLLLFDKSQQCLQINSGSFGTQALRQLDQHGHLFCQREREESTLGTGEII